MCVWLDGGCPRVCSVDNVRCYAGVQAFVHVCMNVCVCVHMCASRVPGIWEGLSRMSRSHVVHYCCPAVDIRLQPWLSKLRKLLLLNLRLEVERLESLAPFLVPTGCPNNWHPGPGLFPHGNSALSFPCGSQAPQPFFCIISEASQGLSGPIPRIGSWSCALPEQHDAPENHSDFILCGVTSRIQCERPWVEMGEESGPSTPPHSSGSKLKIHLVLL